MVAAATSGRASDSEKALTDGWPPASENARPAAWTVRTSDDMLNSVRCSGLRSLLFKWHWLKALLAATIMVSSGPRSSSDAKSTAYDTDMVDPLDVSGSDTFIAAEIEESS